MEFHMPIARKTPPVRIVSEIVTPDQCQQWTVIAAMWQWRERVQDLSRRAGRRLKRGAMRMKLLPRRRQMTTGSPFDGLQYPELTYIDPREFSAVLKMPNPRIEPFTSSLVPNAKPRVMGGDWDEQMDQKFEDLDVFESFRDHFIAGKPWEETRFYSRVAREIASGRAKWTCTTPEQFSNRLRERIDPLYEAMKRSGYRTQSQLSTGKDADEIRVVVDRQGRLLFMDGRHRLAIAKLLGIERIPVKVILRHADWIAFQQTIWEYAKRSGGKIYQKIDHPDLNFFPAQHEDNRFEILCKSLDGYVGSGKRLIDIGTHWGYMCHKFEPLGFDCCGIDHLESNVHFVEGIRDACGRRFEVWHGDVLDYPDVEKADAILALNVFHHFCKTEAGHERLIKLLKRVNADLMFFEAHRHDPPAQMEGAYRNYTEHEFVRFISAHTGLDQWKKLGVASDQRPIFKIWRG